MLFQEFIMLVGILKELKNNEFRVFITAAGVHLLDLALLSLPSRLFAD